MSNVKKIFIAVSAIIMSSILAFMITINNIYIDVKINIDKPKYVNVYREATTTINTSSYEEDDEEYSKVISSLSNVGRLSVYDRLINLKTLKNRINVDSDGVYAKWSTDMKLKNVVIEFVYDEEKDLIVYEGEDTRVVSYWSLAFIIPLQEDLTDIIIYYSTTNEGENNAIEESYKQYQPLVIYGRVSDLLKDIYAL